MTAQHTVALRICINCRAPFGVQVWPWSGERFTQTHGLCGSCFEALQAALDADDDRGPTRPPSLATSASAH